MKTPKQAAWTVAGLDTVIVSAVADMPGNELRAALRVDGRVLAGIEPSSSGGSTYKQHLAPALVYVRGGVLVLQPRYHVQLPTSMAGSELEIGTKLLRIALSAWTERRLL